MKQLDLISEISRNN